MFQAHGVDGTGTTLLTKRLHREQMPPFFSKLPPCLVGMAAHRTAHWARTLAAIGPRVRPSRRADFRLLVPTAISPCSANGDPFRQAPPVSAPTPKEMMGCVCLDVQRESFVAGLGYPFPALPQEYPISVIAVT